MRVVQRRGGKRHIGFQGQHLSITLARCCKRCRSIGLAVPADPGLLGAAEYGRLERIYHLCVGGGRGGKLQRTYWRAPDFGDELLDFEIQRLGAPYPFEYSVHTSKL